jgi:hypothetical protein
MAIAMAHATVAKVFFVRSRYIIPPFGNRVPRIRVPFCGLQSFDVQRKRYGRSQAIGEEITIIGRRSHRIESTRFC